MEEGAAPRAAPQPVIVAVSHRRDEHVRPVLAALGRLGAEAVLLDLGDLPARGRLALAYGAGRDATVATRAGTIRAREVSAVWWRRPRLLRADPRLSPADAGHAVRETAEALSGLAASLRARWVNDPWRDAVALRKPHQLAVAERCGLRVPPTLVTNDPSRARAFLAARRRTGAVHKALAGAPEDWRPTRLVAPRDVERLAALRLAPVVLQEFVPGVDVRVTIAGRALFATAIDARATGSPEDFRPVFDAARVEPCTVPRDLARRLRGLVATLGLRYAAIDLRRRDDGVHVFLEVNPAGQWLFVEERTGQPITAAVARLLAGR